MTTWEEASAKIGPVTDKCLKIAHEVFDAAQAAGHDIWFIWGDGSEPDHVYNRQGRPVLDFMVRNLVAGSWVRDYIWRHRERLGLRHVIWAQHITSTVVQPGVVRKMADRGNPTANHFDHNHAEWGAGSYVPLTPTVPVVNVPVRKGNGVLVYFKTSSRKGTPLWALVGAGSGPGNWIETNNDKIATGWARNTISQGSIELSDPEWEYFRRSHTGTAA